MISSNILSDHDQKEMISEIISKVKEKDTNSSDIYLIGSVCENLFSDIEFPVDIDDVSIHNDDECDTLSDKKVLIFSKKFNNKSGSRSSIGIAIYYK